MRSLVAVLAGCAAGVGVALPVRHFWVPKPREVASVALARKATATGVSESLAKSDKPSSGVEKKTPDVWVDGIIWVGNKPTVILTDGRELSGSALKVVAGDGCLTARGEIYRFRPKPERNPEQLKSPVHPPT